MEELYRAGTDFNPRVSYKPESESFPFQREIGLQRAC